MGATNNLINLIKEIWLVALKSKILLNTETFTFCSLTTSYKVKKINIEKKSSLISF